MVEARWLRWIGPGVIALGAIGLVASTTLGAGSRPWADRGCGGQAGDRIMAPKDQGTAAAATRGAPWYRLDPVVDRLGALSGQRLAVGRAGDQDVRVLDLPGESFAAGPFGGTILVGSDDGATSQLLALDVAAGCTWLLDQDSAVIRRATIDPTGRDVYEMRVDRATRADLGIWRRPVDGRGPTRRVLPAPAADGRFGRTWSTELSWDLAGGRLAVQSCGAAACRTRIVDPDKGAVVSLDAPDLGTLLGVAGDTVVTYEACRGLPCPIVSTDVRTGMRHVLAEAAGTAVVVKTANGPRLAFEDQRATGRNLRATEIDGSRSADLGTIPDGLGLLAPPDRTAATRLPDGWVLLAPDGRLPSDGRPAGSQLRHIPDGATVPLDEATR